jgi:long-chain fatty acid transport protein
VALLSGPAFAAGFAFGENGVRALSMGGAFVGHADDLSAIQHNPAGLTQLSGAHGLLDGQLSSHQIQFQRTNASGDALFAQPVSNTAGAFIAPMIAASYGWDVLSRPLTLAVGVYGPPSVGRYAYAAPDYALNSGGNFVESPNRTAPQRYAVVSRSTMVMFPTLSVAYAVMPRFSIGASLQYVYSRFAFDQVISAEPITPPELLEDARYDNRVRLSLLGRPTATAVIGILARPLNMLSIGASVRPPIPIRANGTLGVEFGPATQALNAQVTGDKVSFAMSFPLEARVGAHVQVLPSLGFNVDFVYEGWSVFDQIVLTPDNIVLTQDLGAPVTLTEVRLNKRWRNTFGFRVGTEYQWAWGLALRAGFLFDTSASTQQTLSLDFPTMTRTLITAGLGYALGPVEVVGAFAYHPTGTVSVTNSEVRAANALGVQGSVIGNGVYNSGGFQASLGVRGHFGGKR